MTGLALFLGNAVLSWLGTGLVRRLAVRHGVLDHPTERSSHSHATPRGGGLAFVLIHLASMGLLLAIGRVTAAVVLVLLIGGALVAAVGWADDRRNLPAGLRLAVHFAVAIGTVTALGSVPSVSVGAWSLPLGPAAGPITVLALVWLMNLYNFMDGIDGIAAGHGLVVALVGAALFGNAAGAGYGAIALAAAGGLAGFLRWNWAPARIFMGDVGSLYLGYLFGALGILAIRSGRVSSVAWTLVVGVFLFDATVTLVRRLVRGDRLARAHRLHAYQRAVQSGLGHATVSGAVMALAAGLGGAVLLAGRQPAWAPALTGCCLAVLAAAYWLVERRRPMWSRPGTGV